MTKEKINRGKRNIIPVLFFLVVFGIAVMINNISLTGRPIFDVEYQTHIIGENFTENSVYEITLDKNITSLLVSGRILGDGNVKIYLDDLVVLDNANFEENGLGSITGLVIGNESVNVTVNEIQEENTTVEQNHTIEVNETVEVNNSIEENVTIEFNETQENETIEHNETADQNKTVEVDETHKVNDTIKLNETIEQNITIEFNDSLEINETVEENKTENITQSIFEFSNLCVETCTIENYPKEIVLRIEVSDAKLILDNIKYKVISGKDVVDNQTLAEVESSVGDVEINKPVKWNKKINASKLETYKLPKQTVEFDSDKNLRVLENNMLLSKRAFNNLKKSKRRSNKNPEVYLKDEMGLVDIDYYTEAPTVEEKIISSGRKTITVSSGLHYENVLTYTDITESKIENIKVYWIKDTGRELFEDVEYIDTNNNGFIDKLQWIIPHLSNQTFEISITVLNPVTYLNDGETWVVAFNTTGTGNLTISSTNAGWTEFLSDDTGTFDEMKFLNLSCETDLLNRLKLIGFDSAVYDYSNLTVSNSIDIEKLFIENYECNSTGYLSNYMIKAGYATLIFEFSNQNMTVSDYAYDPETNITTPNIIPESPKETDILICNFTAFNSTNNITNWYLNNVSMAELIMTFEADSFALDEGNNMTDYSGYGHHGILAGTGANPTWLPTGGKIGGAYNFPGGGSNERVIKLFGLKAPSQEGTVEAWVYVDSYPGIVDILADPGSGGGDFRWYVNNGGTSLYGFFIGSEYRVSTTEEPGIDQWTLITLTWNSSGTFLYFNETYINKNTGTPPAFTGGGLQIGGNVNSGDWNFNGTIDEVRVYNRSLSLAEIKQHYNLEYNKLNANETNTGEEWHCEVTPHDGSSVGTNKNSSSVIIQAVGNLAPSISSVGIMPATANSSVDLDCNATITDSDNSSVTVEYFWYNQTSGNDLIVTGNATNVATGSNQKISTLGSGNTTADETWNCTIMATDYSNNSSYDSDTITITSPPGPPAGPLEFDDDPIISPSTPFVNQTLTCNFNTSTSGVNITNWYVNNKSMMKLYLPFEADGSNNMTDYSGNGNSPSSTGAGTDYEWLPTGGKIGGAYRFYNGKVIDTGQAAPSEEGTVEAWVYPTSYHAILDIAADPGTGGGDFRWYVNNGGSSLYGFWISGEYRVSTTEEPGLNQWTLITLTWNSSGTFLYFNGTYINKNSGTPPAFTGAGIQIGGNTGSGDQEFNGTIDEVRIYNRSLSQAEIRQHFNLEYHLLNANETRLDEQWHCGVTLNNGTGDTISKNSSSVIIQAENTAPVITWINNSVSENPVIGTTKTIFIQFNVTDSDGVDNINDSSAKIYLNRTGETTRYNDSCTAQGISGNTETYVCAIDLQYYDIDGDWTINVSIQDNSASYTENLSATFTYGTLTAIEIGDSLLNFSSVTPGQKASEPVQNPLQVKNLGNQDVVEINVTGYSLWKSSENISAEAFYVNSSLGATGASLVNNTAVIVPSATSSKDTTTTEDNATLYFYIDMPLGLTSGQYNASSAWTINAR